MTTRNPFFVILENVRSLYNVGAAFRTSDGCGVSELHLAGFTGYPPRREISKTALGAEESVPWEHDAKISEVIERYRSTGGGKVVGVEKTNKSICYTDYKFDFPVCLVFGNEIMGVAGETLKFCDDVVHIPMLGSKESLNVATAYGVIMYEVLRQYQLQK